MASLLDRVVVGVLPAVPKPVVRHFSKPYIAGAKIGDAIRVVRDLNAAGALATLDILGENISREEEADNAMAGYLNLLDTVEREKIDSNVSIKLSQLGMKLDIENCYRRIEKVLVHAREAGDRFIRLDMEDSTCTDDTLEIYRRLREGHAKVGVVIQAMLRRSMADIERLAATKANVRLCKGIYVEPRDVAWQDRDTIRRSFTNLLDVLLAGGSYVGIATHDETLVFEALRLLRRHRVNRDQYEFQMLLGVDEELRRIILRSGHKLRVYVPFGEQWYAYSVRRLKENPKLAGTMAKVAFGLK
jgi:proline dehydrogenase